MKNKKRASAKKAGKKSYLKSLRAVKSRVAK
jgi:hypothetical protein